MSDIRAIHIIAPKGSHLNELVDTIFNDYPELPKSLSSFEMIDGMGTLFGWGDPPTLEIKIKVEIRNKKTLEMVDQLLEIARKLGAKIDSIVLTVESE